MAFHFGGHPGPQLLHWVRIGEAQVQAEPIPDSPSPCSTVDDNPDFDNLDIVTRDEEERYFDEEEPEDAPSPELDGD